MSEPVFKPNTVYVTYIASTPDKVWDAITKPEFTRQYFFGHSVEVEQRVGGRYVLRTADGRVHVQGRVMVCDPPRTLSITWLVEGLDDFRKLPECLVTFQIDALEGAVRLTMTEAHSWDIPDAILSGGRQGWPVILSSLKSLIETGKPIIVKMAPPKEMLEAVKQAVGE